MLLPRASFIASVLEWNNPHFIVAIFSEFYSCTHFVFTQFFIFFILVNFLIIILTSN